VREARESKMVSVLFGKKDPKKKNKINSKKETIKNNVETNERNYKVIE